MSAQWLETLKNERRAKEKWQSKYLSQEEQHAIREEELAEAAARKENTTTIARRRGPEMDTGRLQLGEGPDPNEESTRVISAYEATRQRIAEEVSASRQRSHRITGDLSTENMLRDIGPGLWAGVNQSYSLYRNNVSTTHSAYTFDKVGGPA